MVRAAAFLRRALSLENAISIGLKSGEWRQEQEPRASFLDRLAHAPDLVSRQVDGVV